MNQGMSRCSPFDFSESNKITSFEVAITMLKLPQWRFGRSGMKYVADYVIVSYEPPLLVARHTDLYEIHTYSIVVQMKKCSCA